MAEASDEDAQPQAMIDNLERGQVRLRQPGDTSTRTPETIITSHNDADNLEWDLQDDGHCCWGVVI